MARLSVVLITILVVVGLLIIASNQLHVGKGEDRTTFFKLFGSWLFKAGKNVKSVVGMVIHQDWSVPVQNSTNSTP